MICVNELEVFTISRDFSRLLQYSSYLDLNQVTSSAKSLYTIIFECYSMNFNSTVYMRKENFDPVKQLLNFGPIVEILNIS